MLREAANMIIRSEGRLFRMALCSSELWAQCKQRYYEGKRM